LKYRNTEQHTHYAGYYFAKDNNRPAHRVELHDEQQEYQYHRNKHRISQEACCLGLFILLAAHSNVDTYRRFEAVYLALHSCYHLIWISVAQHVGSKCDDTFLVFTFDAAISSCITHIRKRTYRHLANKATHTHVAEYNRHIAHRIY